MGRSDLLDEFGVLGIVHVCAKRDFFDCQATGYVTPSKGFDMVWFS